MNKSSNKSSNQSSNKSSNKSSIQSVNPRNSISVPPAIGTGESLLELKASNYLEQIKIKVKNNMSSNLKIYLIIAIPILLLMIYLVWKYNFNARSVNVISNMNYKSQLLLKPMKQCSDLDLTMQYKLCDYYISSSYMTPCVGNQHYDYVSIDMITEVLLSGARYIQLPICSSDITPNAMPVIGTAQYGQRVITSLNTLEIRDVLNVIRNNSFNLDNNPTNYPLIIHLILHTNNPYTLNNLADNITTVLSDVLCDVPKYKSFPIFLEKICSLLGKIIFIATPEYIGSKLEQLIVPTNVLFESYYYTELAPISLPTNAAFTNEYNNKLSSVQQTQSRDTFKIKYPSLDYVINNASSIGATIINDKDILNNLMYFNKVGMTLVKPVQSADVLSPNYDPAEAVYNGCQLISMNFQTNDDNMKNYLKIFKDSSFVLKPASMRFSEKEESLPALESVYKAISPISSKVINEIYNKYNNRLIALESYASRGMYLTQIENNLRFKLGSTTNTTNTTNTPKLGLNQCFLIKKSTVSMGTADIPMFLLSPSYNMYPITQNGNKYDLEPSKKIKSDIYKQSFVFESSEIADADDDHLVILRTIDSQTPLYLANQNNIPTTYAYSSIIEAQNNMSYRIHSIPFNIIIKIYTLYEGSVKTMSNNIVGVLENNTADATGYILEPSQSNTDSNSNFNSNSNFDYLKNQFYMKNTSRNTYLSYDPNTNLIYDRAGRPDSTGIFNLELNKGFYSLYNTRNETMCLIDNNILKFLDANTVASNQNLFNIKIEYSITN